MAGDKAEVAKAREVERDIVLKAKEKALESSSAIETPRASSVATPRGSAKGVRETPAPRKYVSPMAKAREEKKRCESNGKTNCKDWPSLSDMETCSTPSSGSVRSDASPGKPAANLPKFGEWEKHSVNSGPCYTLLFQNAAQEKKIGGPVRVHTNRSDAPPRTADLYTAVPPPCAKPVKRKQSCFLRCFSS